MRQGGHSRAPDLACGSGVSAARHRDDDDRALRSDGAPLCHYGVIAVQLFSAIDAAGNQLLVMVPARAMRGYNELEIEFSLTLK